MPPKAAIRQHGGSSPRAWGIHVRCVGFIAHDRFIPTCVGNTAACAGSGRWLSVHPHVRGEYAFKLQVRSLINRFIPTCVGNTGSRLAGESIIAVHPHVRGEYINGGYPAWQSPGSSPRAWGIRKSAPGRDQQMRFIPTCVGNTAAMRSAGPSGSVHPHVRGEYRTRRIAPSSKAGSSPRAWGIPISFA